MPTVTVSLRPGEGRTLGAGRDTLDCGADDPAGSVVDGSDVEPTARDVLVRFLRGTHPESPLLDPDDFALVLETSKFARFVREVKGRRVAVIDILHVGTRGWSLGPNAICNSAIVAR